MPNRQQTITWTNADSVYWCIYVVLRGDELKKKWRWGIKSALYLEQYAENIDKVCFFHVIFL